MGAHQGDGLHGVISLVWLGNHNNGWNDAGLAIQCALQSVRCIVLDCSTIMPYVVNMLILFGVKQNVYGRMWMDVYSCATSTMHELYIQVARTTARLRFRTRYNLLAYGRVGHGHDDATAKDYCVASNLKALI